MAEKLTKRQRQVLNEIKNYFHKNKIAPSVRDLSSKLEVTISTIHKLLRTLKDKGYIDLKDKVSRGIILREQMTEVVSVPIVGYIPAGNPVISNELYDGYIEIDSSLVPGEDTFALHVSGDSMTGANILDGDIALLRKQDSAESGDIVAALVDGEATLKRFKYTDKGTFLFPENDDYQPIPLNTEKGSIFILGKLVAVIRKY